MTVSSNAPGMTDLTTNLVMGITGFAGSALSAIGQIVPVALPILGAGIVIAIAIKTMKKFR